MTRKITNLKFWGRPMQYDANTGKFRVAFPSMRLSVSIREERDDNKCHWVISEQGAVMATFAASGVVAARNAAQVWLETRAELTRRMAAKGGK